MTTSDFKQLIARQGNFLHPYAISLTNDYEDARDLYQETLLRALANQDKYRLGTNLKAWLYIIMRNIFINDYRRNKKFGKVDTPPSGEWTWQNGQTTQNQGWSNLRMREIRKAMNELPEIFRLSFELYYAGYKYQEIADLLHEPLGTIKSRIHFARKMLISRLDR